MNQPSPLSSHQTPSSSSLRTWIFLLVKQNKHFVTEVSTFLFKKKHIFMMFQSQDSRIIAIEATTNPDNNSRINQEPIYLSLLFSVRYMMITKRALSDEMSPLKRKFLFFNSAKRDSKCLAFHIIIRSLFFFPPLKLQFIQ